MYKRMVEWYDTYLKEKNRVGARGAGSIAVYLSQATCRGIGIKSS